MSFSSKSLAVKNGISYTVLFLFACVILVSVLYLSTREYIIKLNQDQIKHDLKIMNLELQKHTEWLKRDVQFISGVHGVKQMVNLPNAEQRRSQLEIGFKDFMKQRPE